MAMVAVNDELLPLVEQLDNFIQATWPDSPPTSRVNEKGNVVTFSFGESTAALTLFPMPIPWQHLEGPCATAWYWPEASSEMRRHQRHILVTLIDEGRDPVEKSLRLTKLVMAVAAQCETVGIFWGPGHLVHSPQGFYELSRQMTRDDLPLYLWIDFRLEQIGENNFRLFTTGLEPFGHKEIEVERFQGNPQELLEMVYNVAHYVLDQKKPLNQGDTIGASETQQIAIHHTRSMFDPEQEVIQLEF